LGDDSSPEAERARKIASLARQAITHTRELSHRMGPMELAGEGLPGALKNLAAQTKRLFQIDCQFRGDTALLVNDSTAQTNLYRVAQEAIQNAIKHGKARRIQIGLSARKNDLILSVQDDGVGLQQNPSEKKGYGLRIMDYRASTLGGSLVVRKGKRGGTNLVCSIPYAPAKASNSH